MQKRMHAVAPAPYKAYKPRVSSVDLESPWERTKRRTGLPNMMKEIINKKQHNPPMYLCQFRLHILH